MYHMILSGQAMLKKFFRRGDVEMTTTKPSGYYFVPENKAKKFEKTVRKNERRVKYLPKFDFSEVKMLKNGRYETDGEKDSG